MDSAVPSSVTRPKIGLVLAGGAARGAYEAGVIEHIVEHVSKDLGYDVPLDILCGTSVGAINVCTLAAWADEPKGRAARLTAVWTGLHINEVLHARARGPVGLLRGLLGRELPLGAGALFDAGPLERLLMRAIPFERIDTHLRAGRIHAVTVSATQIGTGRTVVFVQRRRGRPAPWPASHNVKPKAVRLRSVHTLASAAVPLLFPAVKIDGRYYCDGGIRQNIPLSPARRLGAHGAIVINPRFREPPRSTRTPAEQREEPFPSPLFLLGKTLNALTLDRIDNEIDRLQKINKILAAGTRAFGDDFSAKLNEQLGYPPGRGLRPLETVHIRSTQNIGQMCADYVAAPSFHVPGVLGRIMKQLAEGEATREADLLSYLLFDGEFAGRLIDLGRHDAKLHHEELCALFESVRQRA